MLYALGIGANTDELDFLFEMGDLKVFPTFAVVPSFKALVQATSNLNVNPMMILHGEQTVILHNPIPPEGEMSTVSEVTGIYDKGKAALVVVKAETSIDGSPVFDNIFTIFARGEGGFGGDRGPEALKADPPAGNPPDFRVEYKTLAQQALLYRLSGDTNPLHASPQFAAMGGFERPILHGLCTYGHAGRAVLHSVCGGDPARFKSFAARFASVVFPGDTIVTEGWRERAGRYIVRASTQDGKTVLSNSVAEVVE
ncbi:MAG: MaoC family dehydratase N-terminal domain-containing protein [Deltaproteobacteria bacterium]|nr:MaoC family dehydratase N-terminal domain-containing protein [Deltaproteobacteria bacterium]